MSSPRLSLKRYTVATDPLRTERRIELVAVILLLVLCLQLLYSGARLATVTTPSAVAPAADALDIGEMRQGAAVTTQQSDEIRQRPLFWESRRPVEAQAVAVKDAGSRGKVGKLKGIKLLGVFGAGDTAGVIVQDKDKKRRILLGEAIGGWTLEEVKPNAVVFSANGRSETLLLRPGIVAMTTPQPLPATPQKASAGPAPQPARQATGGGEDELSLGGGPR